uniref:Leucine rich repeat and Ig domain containing 4 n=1 Tax=Podarcis muralis TaxID=64176 RepID=A0A670K330_PODMU|nr:leucine-rich repeat and immunoglobulin-like domain-containing nogo receptor-interacting protein 4 [Podarcis muralis]XP_028566989.1 leucine-rich repeat and immunoglobulin-like domain-containing nogo receptor-interacting protein 4 [Podarcis muralis]
MEASPGTKWRPLLLLLLAVIPGTFLTGSRHTCPSRCRCLSQDKVVFCNGRNLTAVPGRIPPDSELLDLSQNVLRTLQQGMFSRLQALKELDLSYNALSNIEPGAFNSLKRLMTLRLTGNKLKMVPSGVFTGLPSLAVLDISENEIVLFQDHSFKDLSSLRKLEAGDNHLIFVSSQAFSGLQSLRQLTLEKCNLTGVPTEALSHLRHLVELRLKVLSIGSVPDHSFQKLHRLKVLEIHRWPSLTALRPHSLAGLNLTALSITRCSLREVPYKAIHHLVHLRFLDLSHNPISVLRGRKLAELSRLQEFHLTGGRLATVQAHAFHGLVHFRVLNLSGNGLRTLEEGAFHSVGNLEVLRLDGNPLACDCRLLWIIRRQRRLNFEARQPVCATNSTGEGKVFRKFSDILPGHITCRKPTIEKETPPQRLSVEEGGRAMLTCKGDGDPPPTISWVSPHNVSLDASRKGRLAVLPNGTLRIHHAFPQDGGAYLCVARNAAGNDTMWAHLRVFSNFSVRVNASALNASSAALPFLLDVGTLAGILAIGIVPFLCSVAICFVFISLWNKGRGTAKHHIINAVPRYSRGYKAVTNRHKRVANKPR